MEELVFYCINGCINTFVMITLFKGLTTQNHGQQNKQIEKQMTTHRKSARDAATPLHFTLQMFFAAVLMFKISLFTLFYPHSQGTFLQEFVTYNR